jgi:hypothetical protein
MTLECKASGHVEKPFLCHYEEFALGGRRSNLIDSNYLKMASPVKDGVVMIVF